MQAKNTARFSEVAVLTWLARTVICAVICLVGLLVVFASSARAQTWSSKGPLPRVAHSGVFDAATNRMIIFGGEGPEEGATNHNDVWRLNGATSTGGLTWTSVKPTGTAPTARQGHSAVYSSANNVMTVFGGGLGSTSPCENDLWSLENANGNGGAAEWVQLSASGSPPPARVFHTAVYDPNTDSMIVFGGEDCFSTDFGDVWVLSHASGMGGTPTWTQLLPSGTLPPPRNAHGATYDPSTNTMTIFGGVQIGGSALNDLWVLSNANGVGGNASWTQLMPSGSAPSPREHMSAVYNSAANRMVIFGGEAAGTKFNDTWVLTNANGSGGTPRWILRSPGASPPEPRESHTAIYNPTSNVMTIFGGDTPVFLNEVWVLTHADGL